jgi:hypothetical protein
MSVVSKNPFDLLGGALLCEISKMGGGKELELAECWRDEGIGELG